MDEAQLEIKLCNHINPDDQAYVCIGFRGGHAARDFFLNSEEHFRGSYAFFEVWSAYLRLRFAEEELRFSFLRSSSYVVFQTSSGDCAERLRSILGEIFNYEYDETVFQKALDGVQKYYLNLFEDVSSRVRYKAYEVSEANKQYQLDAVTDDYMYLDYELFIECAKQLIVPGNMLVYIVGDEENIKLESLSEPLKELVSALPAHTVVLGGYPQNPYLREDLHLLEPAKTDFSLTIESFDFINDDTEPVIRQLILDIFSFMALPRAKSLEVSVDYFDASILIESDEPVRYKRAFYEIDEAFFSEAKSAVLQKYASMLEELPALFSISACYLGLIEVSVDEYVELVTSCTYAEFAEMCETADFKVTEAFVLLRKERNEDGQND